MGNPTLPLCMVSSARRTSFAVDPGTTSPLLLMVTALGAVPTLSAAAPVPAEAALAPAAAVLCVLEVAGVEPRMLPPVSGLFDDPATTASLGQVSHLVRCKCSSAGVEQAPPQVLLLEPWHP